jgi:hypothetical protein
MSVIRRRRQLELLLLLSTCRHLHAVRALERQSVYSVRSTTEGSIQWREQGLCAVLPAIIGPRFYPRFSYGSVSAHAQVRGRNKNY